MKHYYTLTLLLLLSTTLYAQDNYMAVFNNALSCSTVTSTSISAQSGGSNPIYANAAFDGSGNLLFTTNDSAIHSASGTKVYAFRSGGCFPKATNSEEIIFPIPSACNNYYVLFEADADTCGSGNALVAVWVNASGSTPTVVSQTNIFTTSSSGGTVTASKLHYDGTRNIFYFTNDSLYELSVDAYGTFSSLTILDEAPSIISGHQAFSVLTGDESQLGYSAGNNEFYIYEFFDGEYVVHILTSLGGTKTLRGLEYCPVDSDWYVSYSTTSGGGLGYFASSTLTTISGTSAYNHTSLAWTNGHLFFTGSSGDIAYMNITLGSPAPSITTTSISNANYMDGSGSYYGLNKQIEGGSNYSLPPTITVSASPSTICYNSSSTLTASGASTYTWSPTTELSDSIGSSVIATLTATTTYTVTGTDSTGCVNTANVSITVYPQLFAHSGGNKSICLGSNDTLGSHPAASGGILDISQ